MPVCSQIHSSHFPCSASQGDDPGKLYFQGSVSKWIMVRPASGGAGGQLRPVKVAGP